MARYHPTVLRSAWWAWRSAGRVQRSLRRTGLDDMPPLSPPPPVATEARRGVTGALIKRGSSCLVSSIVLQRWDAAQGWAREVVIGVTGINDFEAHAWLDGEPDDQHEGYTEIRRLRASA